MKRILLLKGAVTCLLLRASGNAVARSDIIASRPMPRWMKKSSSAYLIALANWRSVSRSLKGCCLLNVVGGGRHLHGLERKIDAEEQDSQARIGAAPGK